MDLAASIQAVTEEVMLRMARTAQRAYRLPNTCVSPVAWRLNCVANGKLLRAGIFDDIWIQPAAGDAGGSLGAALFVHHQLLDHPRASVGRDTLRGSLLGPRFTNDDIRVFLDSRKIPYTQYEEESELLRIVAEAMAGGQGGRVVPRPDGIWSARARFPQHHWRRAQ